MLRGSLTVQALRHRRGQAVLLLVLSTLITAATVIGPLYQAAVNESVVRAALDNAPVSATGLSIHYDEDGGPIGPAAMLQPEALRLYGPETDGEQASIGLELGPRDIVPVTLASRAGICDHLHFTEGGCPAGAAQVAVSADTARADRLHAGSAISLTSDPEAPGAHVAVKGLVAGIYATFDPATPYWFDRPYVGPVPATHQQPDAIFTGDGYLDDTIKALVNGNGEITIDRFIDVPLVTRRVGVAQVDTALHGVDDARATMSERQGLLDTALDSLLVDSRAGRSEVGHVVPLFAGELVLLAVALLLFVVSAAATERRPEVALARLRGRRPRSAAGLVVRELAGPVLLGIPAGALVAVGALELARSVWLPPGVPLGVGRSALVALGVALLVQLLVIGVVARRLVREPVVSLLRRVPVRGTRVRLGPLEVGVGALALAGVLTVVSSGQSGPVAVLAPGLLALAVGLLAGGLVPVLAAWIGPKALARGRARAGLGALQMARRPGTRGVFVLLVVAVAALVAVADCWQVARDNRTARAGVEVGAPAVLHVAAASMRQLSTATTQLDPSGRRVVPTAQIVPPNTGVSLLALPPAGAAAVADWGWPDDRPSAKDLARLNPHLPATITLTGGSVDVRLSAVTVRGGKLSDLYLDIVDATGVPVSYDLGPVPRRAGTVELRRPIPCEQGCRWQGLTLVRALTDSEPQLTSLQVDAVSVGASTAVDGAAGAAGKAVDLGPATAWRSSTAAQATEDQLAQLDAAVPPAKDLTDPPDYALARVTSVGTGLRLSSYSAGDRIGMVHGDVPLQIPALTSAVQTVPGQPAHTFTAGRLDGVTQAYVSVGGLAAVPSLLGASAVVDLGVVARLADRPNSATSYAVWLADGSPANVRRQTDALARMDVRVSSVQTEAGRVEQLNRSGAVWSLRLGLVAAVAGVLVAMAVLVIGVITTLRSRRYDLAALGLAGVPRRVGIDATVGEQVVLSALGSAVGAACGIVGSRLLFRVAPYLAGGVGFPGSRVFTAWLLATAAWVAVLVVLVAVSVAAAWQVIRRAVPSVVREGAT